MSDINMHAKCDEDIVRLGDFQNFAITAAEEIVRHEKKLSVLLDAGSLTDQRQELFLIRSLAAGIVALGDLSKFQATLESQIDG